MSAVVPSEQRHVVTGLPAAWEWELEGGYHELTLAPRPAGQHQFDVTFAGLPLLSLKNRGRSGSSRSRLTWPLAVPSRGRWSFRLQCPELEAGSPLTAVVRRMPLPQATQACELCPRGLWLEDVPEDRSHLLRRFEEAAALGVSFVLVRPESLANAEVVAAAEAAGLLALADPSKLPPFVEWEGPPPQIRPMPAARFSPSSACRTPAARARWVRGGAMSPLVAQPEAAPWSYHLTTNGVISFKHATWSDLAEVWYHPSASGACDPPQALMLARLRGVATDEAELPAHAGGTAPAAWQPNVPQVEGPGLLHLRWLTGDGLIAPAAPGSSVQRAAEVVLAAASGDMWCPWFPEDRAGASNGFPGRGVPLPEAVGFVRSRLEVRSLWSIQPGPGRRMWPDGVTALKGFERPSSTPDVLIALRIAPSGPGNVVLFATVEAKSAATIAWDRSRGDRLGDAAEGGASDLREGTSRLVLPLGTSCEGWSFLIKAPRRLVRLVLLEGVEIPISAVVRSSGPHWAESEITSRLMLDGRPAVQRWSVSMMRNEPWCGLTAEVRAESGPSLGARARLVLDVPRYDRLLVNGRALGGAGWVTRAVRLVVLRDSGGRQPDLTIAPLEEGAVWTIQQLGATLSIEASADGQLASIFAVGNLERWGGASTIRKSLGKLIRPVSLDGQAPVRLRNTAAKAVAAFAEIDCSETAPYWVNEVGWWRRVESQPHEREQGRSRIVPLHIPGRSSVVLARGNYLNNAVRPTPGSQTAISLAEPEPDGAVVRVDAKPAFDAPLGVQFRQQFASVTCNGRPWHVHDGTNVWLPGEGVRHRIRVAPTGEPAPAVVRPSLGIVSTRWTGARLTIRLSPSQPPAGPEGLTVRFPHTLFDWIGVEGGTAQPGDPGLLVVRPSAQTVHVRFVPRRTVRPAARRSAGQGGQP